MQGQNVRRWAGVWVDRQVAHPIISFGPDDMIGLGFFLYFVRTLDQTKKMLLKDIACIITNSFL